MSQYKFCLQCCRQRALATSRGPSLPERKKSQLRIAIPVREDWKDCTATESVSAPHTGQHWAWSASAPVWPTLDSKNPWAQRKRRFESLSPISLETSVSSLEEQAPLGSTEDRSPQPVLEEGELPVCLKSEAENEDPEDFTGLPFQWKDCDCIDCLMCSNEALSSDSEEEEAYAERVEKELAAGTPYEEVWAKKRGQDWTKQDQKAQEHQLTIKVNSF